MHLVAEEMVARVMAVLRLLQVAMEEKEEDVTGEEAASLVVAAAEEVAHALGFVTF